LKFKSLFLITIHYLKVTNFMIGESLNPTKKTILQVSKLLPSIIHFIGYREGNIDINTWLTIIQILNNLIHELIGFWNIINNNIHYIFKFDDKIIRFGSRKNIIWPRWLEDTNTHSYKQLNEIKKEKHEPSKC